MPAWRSSVRKWIFKCLNLMQRMERERRERTVVGYVPALHGHLPRVGASSLGKAIAKCSISWSVNFDAQGRKLHPRSKKTLVRPENGRSLEIRGEFMGRKG